MKKEILKQLRSDYERLETKPSADLWDRIEQEMENRPVLSVKKYFQWWKYAAVMLLLLSVGMLLYFNGDFKKKNTHQIAQSKPLIKGYNTEENSYSNQDSETVQERNIITDVSFSESQGTLKQGRIQKDILKKSIKTEGLVSVQKEKNSLNDNEVKTMVIEKVSDPNPEKGNIAEHKKTNYINADELLQGREFDKTRQESHNEHKKFGVLDMTKIKIKSPNSLKIFGMTVYSDSLETH